ncbi:MAG: SurA N-terminal domain-containing protein [Deltaproteobacteria bacterium]|nr:SurA N-terminal domain-containing protein [Deltaproteobacteria bacterium]
MLDMMRRQSESFLIYLIFGAIIVVFVVNFGPGSGSCRPASPNYAAMVDGDVILQQAFYADYSRQVESYRRRAQAANIELNNETLEKMGLKKQVIDALVNKKLLAHEAAKRGLTVSDDELVKYLETRYGVKDVTFEQYSNWVERSFETTVSKFEAEVRNEILGQKIERFVNEQVMVSDDELKADYLREHDRAMVTYVKFDPADVAVDSPSKDAVAKVLADDYPAVEASYNEAIMKYRTPHRVKARQIAHKLAAGASDADVAKARSALLDLKSQIQDGADFASLAKEHSQDAATAAKGGDLGTLDRGQVAKEMDAAIFALKKDEITPEPVRVGDMLVLIQVTDIEPPARKKLEEVKDEVAANLLKERLAQSRAQAEADLLLAKLKKGEALDKLTVGENEPKDKPKAEKPKAERGATAVALPVRYDAPWVLKSQGAIPRIGASKELFDAVFALTKEQPLAGKVFQVGKAFYVVTLKDRETPDPAKFDSEKESLRQQALWAKRTRLYREWVEHLKQTARIQYNPSLFSKDAEANG